MGKIKDVELFTLIHDFFKTYLPSSAKQAPIQSVLIRNH